ncbi:MAG TPA: hypothetical protein VGM82_00985 [Gemmatimonadaceae bacterium]|jgi:hypothetical protein
MKIPDATKVEADRITAKIDAQLESARQQRSTIPIENVIADPLSALRQAHTPAPITPKP